MTRISAMKASVWVLLAVLAALPVPLLAQAQSAGGAIEGTVTDESGAVLPGATVTVRHLATGVSRETTTDGVGIFRAPLLPVGGYEVTAALSGFATVRRQNLTLTIGQTLAVDVALKVASASEEITVSAEAPIWRRRARSSRRRSASARSRTCR